MVRTRLPTNFYSLFLKIIIIAYLFTLVFENLLLAIGSGILSGLILHVWGSYYDCVVTLKGSKITFFFIRPFLFKEEHDLSRLDNGIIIRENNEKVLKEVWWNADTLMPIHYDIMVLYKDEITYSIKFKTNHNDLPLLEAAVKSIFNTKSIQLKSNTYKQDPP